MARRRHMLHIVTSLAIASIAIASVAAHLHAVASVPGKTSYFIVGLQNGCVEVGLVDKVLISPGLHASLSTRVSIRLVPQLVDVGPTQLVQVPTWLPLLPFGIWVAFRARWIQALRHNRRRRGTCAACGYPITGASKCPECGTSPELASARPDHTKSASDHSP